jgi:GTP pyrophosphokinase
MRKIRKELEDLAFPFVYPEEAKQVQGILAGKYGKSEIALEKERKILQKRLAEVGVLGFHTSFRVKGLYSMFHKLKRKDWEDTAVLDLLAMRVVVTSVDDCYRVLGIIHELWRPLPGRVKDYIAFHKPNGYQSLHTTITTQNGVILEIQIRTEQMHREAEYGVASHIIYKNKQGQDRQKTKEESTFARLVPHLFRPFSKDNTPEVAHVENGKAVPHEQKIPGWISQIGQIYTKNDNSTSQFIEDAETDFFSNRIFVFTPTGDVVDLPAGATPIDFAFSIHSDIGEQMSSAKVNRKMSQLDIELHNGDIVEIETRKSAHPTEKWLLAAKTSIAKRKIRAWLDKHKDSAR